jgi:hypothetical protein
MITRRSFFRSLVFASAAIYLRLAPTHVNAIPGRAPASPAPAPAVYDDCIRRDPFTCNYMYRGKSLTATEALAIGAIAIGNRPRVNPRYFQWEPDHMEWDGNGVAPGE